MNLITATANDYWKRVKTKNSPAGWCSRNAPCCHHRGESPDKRGRGGMKIDVNETCSVNCFNCGFTASYSPGKPLYPKFQNLLKWLGVDEYTLGKLKIESLREAQENNSSPDINKYRDIKPIDMPDCKLLSEVFYNHTDHVDFLKRRGFDITDYPFLVSSDLTLRNRVIVPFIFKDTLIGYSARSIKNIEKNRYLMKMTTDFVFGLEFVEDNHKWIIVQEGILDALSIHGLATMHNEVSEAQAEMIHDLGKKVIVVPDLDKAGLANRDNTLINTALDYNWSVSFPEWNVKDINAAYVNYGPLFTVKHILQTATDNHTTIRLKQKMLNNRLKKSK